MGYLNNIEQDFVLGDIEVFNEFDMSHFISNAKSAITNKAETVNTNLTFSYYTSMLEKAISSFADIKLNKDTIKDFLIKFNKIDNLDNGNMLVKDINTDDIEVFKPQYLGQYVSMVQDSINGYINGESNFADCVKFMTSDYPTKVERQIVKTNLPYGITSKELRKETTLNGNFIKADTKFIKDKVLPFVTKYDTFKADTLTEANMVLNAIKEAELSVKAMLGALNKLRTVEGVTPERLNQTNQIAYNSIRGIMDIISYVSFMMVHKLNVISSNVITCNKLYTDIFNMYGGTVTETAFDNTIISNDEMNIGTNLMNGDVSAYTILSNNIYEYHNGMVNNIIAGDPTSNDIEYPKDIFDDIVKAYIVISEGLNIMSLNCADYLLVFNDVLEQSGFSIVLVDRFREDINHINDTSMYNVESMVTPDINMYKMMMNEVKNYSDNMQSIANTCNETFKKLILLQEKFASNINGEYKDIETVNEIKVFLKDLREQYVDMTNTVAKNFMNRLKTIGDRLTIMDTLTSSDAPTDSTIPIDTNSDVDFSESAYELELSFVEENCKTRFNNLQKYYLEEKNRRLNGLKTVFEANTSNTNGSTNTTNNNQNQTTPKVIDNSNANNSNANGNNNQQNNQTSSNTINDLINQIIKFFSDMKNNIMKAIDKNAKHNTDFLQANKDGLLNRSYSNVTVQVIPYSKVPIQTITGHMDRVVNNIGALTPQTLQEIKTQNDVYKKVFPFIAGLTINEGDNTNIKQQMLNFYMMGNASTAPAMVNVSNGELKNEVANEYIPYVEKYYTTTKEALASFSENTQAKLEALTKSINTESPNNAGNLNESVDLFMEDNNNQPNKNTETSMSTKSRWVIAAVKIYTNAVTESLQKRNNDYLKILTSLKVEAKKTGDAKVSDGNDAQNQPAQNNQQPEQNANNQNTNV